MQQFRDIVASPAGRPIPGATVTVTISGGGTPTLYSDNGVTALGSNVLTTDANGEYKFYAANGRYSFAIAAAGYSATTRDVVMFDPRDDRVNVKDWPFMAAGNGAVDDTAEIQAAIDAAHAAGGGAVHLPNGRYVISQQGTRGGRGYCLIMKSGVFLVGESPRGVTLAYSRTASTVDLVVTSANGSFPSGLVDLNMGLRNIVFDGNSDSAEVGNGFNLWMQLVDGLVLENIFSINATSWGARIERCERVSINNYGSNHGPDVNADGIHFVDCNNVTGDGFNLYSEGDDTFIVETLQHDMHSLSFTNVNVRAPTAGLAGGRGMLVLHESVISTAQRSIRNLSIQGNAYDCYGQALQISGAIGLSDSYFNVNSNNCGVGLYLQIGLSSVAGYVRNCTFIINSSNPTGRGVQMETTPAGFFGAGITNNHIQAQIYNPGNNIVGARILGEYWTGSIKCDYDPLATKTLFATAIEVYARYSDLHVTTISGNVGVQCLSGAVGNTFHVGRIVSPVTYSFDLAASTLPTISGGLVSGAINGTPAQGFFGGTPAAKPTGVAVSAAGVHAALVTLGLISA